MIRSSALSAFLTILLSLSLISPVAATPPKPIGQPAGACGGRDLLELAKRANPRAYRAILDKTSAIANAEGLLWKIDRPGAAPSFLFGTMHVTDDRTVATVRSMAKYIGGVHTVATELGDFMNPATKLAIGLNAARRALTSKIDTTSLIPSVDDRERVADALKALHMDPTTAMRMPPWLLVSVFAVPACELARQRQDLPTVDQVIMDIGRRFGIKIEALETADEQLDALQSLDPALVAHEIVALSRTKQLAEDAFATMLALYREQRIGALLPMTETLVDTTPEEVDADRAFAVTIVEQRNLAMADRAKPLIDAGPVFIAVGALHLIGRHGLVELLRQKGYKVTRMQ